MGGLRLQPPKNPECQSSISGMYIGTKSGLATPPLKFFINMPSILTVSTTFDILLQNCYIFQSLHFQLNNIQLLEITFHPSIFSYTLSLKCLSMFNMCSILNTVDAV